MSKTITRLTLSQQYLFLSRFTFLIFYAVHQRYRPKVRIETFYAVFFFLTNDKFYTHLYNSKLYDFKKTHKIITLVIRLGNAS